MRSASRAALLRRLAAERRFLRRSRPAPPGGAARRWVMVGLALSGGGIRSATFNLGILQSLAEHGRLRRIDYLSTVSGGGYIGSWLSALVLRARLAGLPDPLASVEARLAPAGYARGQEPNEIRFLRAYSNYLTPRVGLLSGDTLAAVGVYTRNFLLNFVIVVFTLWAAILALHVLLALIASPSLGRALPYLGVATVAAAYAALSVISLNLILQSLSVEIRGFQFQGPRFVALVCGGGLLLAAMTGGLYMVLAPEVRLHAAVWELVRYVLFGMAIGLVFGFVVDELVTSVLAAGPPYHMLPLKQFLRINVIAWLRAFLRGDGEFRWWTLAFGGTVALGLGLIGAFRALPLARVAEQLPVALPSAAMLVTIVGPLVSVGIAVLLTAWVGLLGNAYTDFSREWLARLVGIVMALAGTWFVVCTISFLARPALLWIGHNAGPWIAALLTSGWFGATALGLAAAQGQRFAAAKERGAFRRLVALTPHVFAVGLLVLLASVIQEILIRVHGRVPDALADWSWGGLVQAHFDSLASALAARPLSAGWLRIPIPLTPALVGAAVCAALALLAAWRVDVNTFSIHNLYKNRLVRCYLGASRGQRNPNPFSGFDAADDLPLAHLRQRPYHLINAALNLTQGQDLAWQQRKAASFLFSPMHCGYHLESSQGRRILPTATVARLSIPEPVVEGGFTDTRHYSSESSGAGGVPRGINLGSAFAISGAAVSAQMGPATTPALAFLLTMFNVRLGRWLPNPAHGGDDHQVRTGPPFGLLHLFKELFGGTNERSTFVYVSDGGHFDNLGIYELVRRRCPLVICADAGADPGRRFDDLGNAIRKCAIDLGTQIEIDVGALRADPATRRSRAGHAFGRILYPATEASAAFVGDLVYIKPSLTGLPPLDPDLSNYAANSAQFPHEPTTDQWFNEAQFESYRKLGYVLGAHCFGQAQSIFARWD